MRIIFMGSPDFAVPTLEALSGSRHEVVGVVTQPDRPFGRKLKQHAPAVKVSAVKLKLPVLQPETTRTPEFVAQVKALKPDILVVVAYGEILRTALLQAAPRGSVNLHASLLPKYRGAAPVAHAILNGEPVTGCTTMMISEKMDAGPILLQETCAIDPEDTTGTLTHRLSVLGAPLMVRTLDLLELGQIQPAAQDEASVTFASKLRKEDGRVNWTHTADRINRQVRAFDPWPGTFSRLKESTIKFWLCRASEATTQADPGVILETNGTSVDVACGEGTVLQILKVQPENRPKLDAIDFIHGAHLKPGMKFDSVTGVS